MKASGFFAVLLLATLCLTPSYAAGAKMDEAVALAAQDSGAGLSDICLAAFNAVKESPEEMDKVFAQVIGQRTSWTSGEVYAILRSVLLARPELGPEAASYVMAYEGLYAGISTGEQGSNAGDAYRETVVSRLFAALHEASLADGVARTVIHSMASNAAHLAALNAGHIDATSRGGQEHAQYSLPTSDLETTPVDMSPQY